jgi:hypothetical protein
MEDVTPGVRFFYLGGYHSIIYPRRDYWTDFMSCRCNASLDQPMHLTYTSPAVSYVLCTMCRLRTRTGLK